MAWKTIDLDAPGGYEKYEKLQKTKSVAKAFEDEENPFEQPQPKVQKVNFTKKEVQILKGKVKGVNSLRVRLKPEGDVLYTISEDSIVKILGEEEGWYKVETAPNRQGYCMKQFIEIYTETVFETEGG